MSEEPTSVKTTRNRTAGQANLSSSLLCFADPLEYQITKKEYTSGAYRLSAYYLAKLTSEFPLIFFYPLLLLVGTYFLTGYTLTARNFFAFGSAFLLMNFVAQVSPSECVLNFQ